MVQVNLNGYLRIHTQIQIQVRREPNSGSGSERTLLRFSLEFGENLTQGQVRRESC